MPNEEEEVIVVKGAQVRSRLDRDATIAALRQAADALESGELSVESPEES